MSQEHQSSGSNDLPEGQQSSRSGDATSRHHPRPSYMTVGTGSLSQSAHQLTALLDEDSGYGGSIADNESIGRGWHPGLTEDRPTPSHTPVLPGETNPAAENERRVVAGHIHQLVYNQNKTSLGRAITRTIEALKKLRETNSKWPAHYPSVHRADSDSHPPQSAPRPGLSHTLTSLEGPLEHSHARPRGPRRAGTSLGEDGQNAESSSAGERRQVPEPRLVTPQLAQDFSVLKIDLKLGNLSQTEIVHSLEKQSISTLLEGQIDKSVRHLFSLRERIEDTSSKVLVTGDLNAGKSTFCNALLRRKVLPEDQQPCTSIFCEVLDARENAFLEEVHAIPVGKEYHRDDESTYRVFQLQDLEKIVIDNERWSQCKVYVKDIRSVDESLLNNGVVDIALIDAPGLNFDSLKTTANFAKQEEIDVVVFVVSAANHFTQSAKEFIFNAAHEKAYIFMVVNGFDTIKDKTRCQERILKQVHHLSPATFKESAELVHFVSSNAIPVAPAPGSTSGGGSSSGGFDDPGSEPDGSDDDGSSGKHGEPGSPVEKDKGKQKEKMRDFSELETSLRRFVLEKRARSKLAPAKTYLLNLLGDLDNLATVNRDVAQGELDRVIKELEELEPVLEQSKKATVEAGDGTDHTIEDTVSEVYNHTRETLTSIITHVSEQDLGIPYPGLLSAYQYADDLKYAMLQEISDTVGGCEQYARERTAEGVNMIKSLGLLHLGNGFTDFQFRSEIMFRRKKDVLARQVDVEVEVTDFFDFASLWERNEKIAGTSMAVTVAGVVGTRVIGGVHWVDGALGAARIMGSNNLRKLVIPGIIAGVVLGVSYALASIPQALPRRLSAKVATQLAAIDYTHANASRISAEVRRALKYPADNLRVGLQRSVEKLQGKKEETSKLRGESEVARKYFMNLVRESSEIKHTVERVDLEGPAPGVAAAFDP